MSCTAFEGTVVPTLTTSANSISELDYLENFGPSEAQSFEVSGSSLDGTDVTVSLPVSSDFEISETTAGTYSNSITLSAFDGTSKTIIVRLKAGLAINSYSDTISISGGAASATTVAISGEVEIPTYCDAGPNNSVDSEIENVTLNGETTSIANNTTDICTGGSGGFVNDFTSQSADLAQGSSYDLLVEFGDCNNGNQYDGAGGVWIDWNNDYDFDDANEEIGTANVAVGGGNVIETFIINVPSGQAIGSYRMRIVQNESEIASSISPCGTFSWGSVEDYTIQVIAPSGNDDDTEVIEDVVIAGATVIAADTTTPTDSQDALAFFIFDQGSGDGLPTNVTRMRFVPGANNTAAWTTSLQGVTLYDDNLNYFTPTTTITDTEIILDFDTPIVIGDGDIYEFFFGFYLNTTDIVDGSILQFEIEGNNSGFNGDDNGSDFADSFELGAITGNNFTIDVDFTEIVFSQQPSTTSLDVVMSPAVEVSAVDENGNLDTDYDLEISITSSGNLSESPVNEVSIGGIATFTNLIHEATGSGLVLTASDDLNTDAISNSFDIVAGPVVLAIQDFDGTTPEWTYTTSIPFFGNSSEFDDFYGIIDIADASPIDNPDFSNNILGENDLENNNGGTADFATITFDDIDIDGFENVTLSFDWDIVGYNAANDDAKYEVFYDGIGQNEVFLVDGGADNETNQGFVSIGIPDNVSIVGLEVSIRNNGGSGYSGFDNFKITGIAPNPVNYTFVDGTWFPSDPTINAPANIDNFEITSGDAIISADLSINKLTIRPGASLSVETSQTLTTNEVLLESNSQEYSSLILADDVTSPGSISGNITYKRYTNEVGTTSANGGNDLISAPLIAANAGFDNFITFGSPSNSEILATNTAQTLYAFGPYDNINKQYINFEVDATDALKSGKGYRAATTDGIPLSFEGTVETGSPSITITNPEGGDIWNLIGNPYPSYLKSTGADSFLNASNIAALDPNATAIYGYHAGTTSGTGTIGNFTIINALTNGNVNIAPGQGFFVAHDPDNNVDTSVTFTPSMTTTTGSDDFILNREANEISMFRLKVSNTNKDFATEVYFNDNASLGLDPGYDAAVMGAFSSSLMLYSHLVENNLGRSMAIQALGSSDLSDVTIPLGLIAAQAQQITFSLDANTLPANIDVYLDDNETNTSTLLNASDYVITPSIALDGTGRFFLRLTSNTLSNTSTDFQALDILTSTSTKEIIINGYVSKNSISQIFDLQGRLVETFTLDENITQQRLDVSNLSSGVYVLKMVYGTATLSKKLILK